jgi:hypothetical protein
VNLNQLIELVQDEVNDAGAKRYPLAQVVRSINTAHRNVVRLQVQEDETFHNFELTLLAVNATKVAVDIWRWVLPHYVSRISQVFVDHTTTERRGMLLPPARSILGAGWSWFAGSQFELRGCELKDLRLTCIKEPALLSSGTLPSQAGVAAPWVQLASFASQTYPMDRQSGKYINSVLEITGGDAGASVVSGQIVRIESHLGVVESGGSYYPQVKPVGNWTTQPTAGSTYAFRLETPESATDLVVLEAVADLYRDRGAFDSLAKIQQSLMQARKDFGDFVQPRDDHDMHVIHRVPSTYSRSKDLDRELF